jgi:hypothetical protein
MSDNVVDDYVMSHYVMDDYVMSDYVMDVYVMSDYVVGRSKTMLPFLLLPQLQTFVPPPLPPASGRWPVKKN